MRNLGIAALVVVGIVLFLGVAIAAFTGSKSTTCYGIFDSAAAAERAASAAGDAGLETDVDDLGSEWAVTFAFGDTGNDAADELRTFDEIVERERGELGHPGNGCLEGGPLDG